MPKTFADYAPHLQADMIGMWFNTPRGEGIYLRTDSHGENLFVVPVERALHCGEDMLQSIPCFDKHRVWRVDGASPEQRWAFSEL